MSANKFVLKHHRIEVDYTRGATPGLPALIYRDGNAGSASFTAAQITIDQTGLGTLVSVTIESAVDSSSERFGFFVPDIDVPRGQSAEFRTVGVYYRASGPDSVPQQDPSWRCVELSGTAQSVIVPLETT
jgi:hypothetical protein